MARTTAVVELLETHKSGLKVFSNAQTMKYETLEDVYNFFGLAILKRNPSEEQILERKKIPW